MYIWTCHRQYVRIVVELLLLREKLIYIYYTYTYVYSEKRKFAKSYQSSKAKTCIMEENMKKFKKIAAIIVATVTLAATAITASAADWVDWGYWVDIYHNRGAIKADYYLANNTIHYTALSDDQLIRNVITFTDVDKTLMEGNVVLSIDYSNPNATNRRDRYPSLNLDTNFDFVFDLNRHLDYVQLKDKNGKFITEGKYPLTYDYNASARGYINVIVDTNQRVFSNFDMSFVQFTSDDEYASYIFTESDKGKDTLSIGYIIKDIMALPSYNLELREITNSSTPAKISGGYFVNNCCAYTFEPPMTSGCYIIKTPTQYRGKSFYVYANGWNLGKVTLPYKSTSKVSYTNY